MNLAKKETHQVPEKTIQEKRAENQGRIKQLTNKNKDYIVKLNRQLQDRGWGEDQITEALYTMLPSILDQQENHITARKLYGTPTEQADYLTANPNQEVEVVEKSESWKLYVDGALLLGGLLAIINGAFQMFGSSAQLPMGAMALFLNFLLAGGAMLVIGKYAPQPGQKGGFLKYILASTGVMLVWMLFFSVGIALIPPAINPPVSPELSIAIGVAALVAKYFFKRHFDVRGTLM